VIAVLDYFLRMFKTVGYRKLMGILLKPFGRCLHSREATNLAIVITLGVSFGGGLPD